MSDLHKLMEIMVAFRDLGEVVGDQLVAFVQMTGEDRIDEDRFTGAGVQMGIERVMQPLAFMFEQTFNTDMGDELGEQAGEVIEFYNRYLDGEFDEPDEEPDEGFETADDALR